MLRTQGLVRPQLRDEAGDFPEPAPPAQATQPAEKRDPLYLFACHLEWRLKRNIRAYSELMAALDDPDGMIRRLAERLLHRSSPRPHRGETPSTGRF